MTTTPTLEDWQVQLGNLLMGPGTPYDIAEAEGLDELPDLRDDDEDRPGQHGQDSGPDKASGRTVDLALEVMGTDAVPYTTALADLRSATAPDEDGATVPLWFRLPGQPVLRLDVKPRKRRIPTNSEYEMGFAEADVQLRAPRPFAYGAELTDSTALTSTGTGGLTYPLDYPLEYGDAGSTGRLVLTNDGTASSRQTYTAWGPFDDAGFELLDLATGRRLVYAAAIDEGSWVVINSANGRVLEQGTASRRYNLTRAQWAPVPPRSTAVVQINALGVPQATARLDVAWSPTYWL
jgi:hypothetical protein